MSAVRTRVSMWVVSALCISLVCLIRFVCSGRKLPVRLSLADVVAVNATIHPHQQVVWHLTEASGSPRFPAPSTHCLLYTSASLSPSSAAAMHHSWFPFHSVQFVLSLLFNGHETAVGHVTAGRCKAVSIQFNTRYTGAMSSRPFSHHTNTLRDHETETLHRLEICAAVAAHASSA